MHITHHNPLIATKTLREYKESLRPFLDELQALREQGNMKSPYSALWQWQDEKMLHEVTTLVGKFKKPKHVVLVGIGGSSLSTEAVHALFDNEQTAQLHILDTLAPHETKAVFSYLKHVKKVEDIVVCIVSKSGKTTETLLNAEVVLTHFAEQFGKELYSQTIFISTKKAPLKKAAEKLKAHHIAMPDVVSGRFSAMTPASLVPLSLLGHDIEAFLEGFQDASTARYLDIAADQAAFHFAHQADTPGTLQLFVFDTRLVRFAKWYRQLFAESLGKEKTIKGKKYTGSVLVPTIASAVELHSTAQLYFSKVGKTYTEFFNFDEHICDYRVGKKTVLSPIKDTSLEEARRSIAAGTLDAAAGAKLPYVEYFCDEALPYSIGLLMGLKMHTVVCLASLMAVDPFDQPAIESYKKLAAAHLAKKK